MAGSAAHLVDCVLPSVPTRQYVLAFPYELSGLAATRPGVLSALSRIFWNALRVRYRKWEQPHSNRDCYRQRDDESIDSASL
jgi:hypothetical protein